MATTIKIKQSATASNVPTSGQLVQGELAINVTDKKLYSKDATTVFEIGSNSWLPLSNTKAQFNTACSDGTFLFSGDVTSDTGVPAMLSSGGLPVLNTGITAAEYRTAIGAGTSSTTGTVTSVSGTGTVSGLTLTGTVTGSGSLTLGGAITGFATGTGSASGTNTGDEPAASTTVAGVVELATTAETEASTLTDRAVTPSGLAAFLRNVTTGYDSGSVFVSGTTPGTPAQGDIWFDTSATASVAWGDITSTPTTLSGYGITDAAASSHTHTGTTISNLDAGDTTTGTFDIARIPTGTTSSTVSLGNHTHAASTITSGNMVSGVNPYIAGSTGNAAYKIVFGNTTSTTSGAAALYKAGNATTELSFNPTSRVFTAGYVSATLSDERLKENITDYVPTNLSFKARKYDMKDGSAKGRVGYIAQEVLKELPEAVHGGGEDGILTLDYVMILVAKVAQLEARLEEAGL